MPLVDAMFNYLTVGRWNDSLKLGRSGGQRASLIKRNNPDQSGPFMGDGIPDDHPLSLRHAYRGYDGNRRRHQKCAGTSRKDHRTGTLKPRRNRGNGNQRYEECTSDGNSHDHWGANLGGAFDPSLPVCRLRHGRLGYPNTSGQPSIGKGVRRAHFQLPITVASSHKHWVAGRTVQCLTLPISVA